MNRPRPEALLIDLDGVLRLWDPAWPAEVERRYGLPGGALHRTAFDWSRLRPVLAGQVSHAEWLSGVAAALAAAESAPAGRMAEAVAEWQTHRGAVDAGALGFVREVRAAGRPVVLATNGTDRLADDLAGLDLAGEFDAVVNSARLGTHKPTREFFAAARAAAEVPADRCLFVDDEDRAVRAARVAGLSAYRWTGPDQVGYLRAAFGTVRPGVA